MVVGPTVWYYYWWAYRWILPERTRTGLEGRTTTTGAENGVSWRWPLPWRLLLQSNHINLTINHSLSYWRPIETKVYELSLFYRFYGFLTMSSRDFDSWRRLLPRGLFLQLNDIDITSRLRLYKIQPIWSKVDELSLIQRNKGRHCRSS